MIPLVRFARARRWLAPAAILVLVGALLFVQDQRHGWPFSRHHITATLPEHTPVRATLQASTATARASVEIDPVRLEAAGVRFEVAQLASIADPVRTVATVVADERRVSHVHTRVSGWVERLYVNTTGQSVRAGEPVALVFSQELLSSQNEYLAALRASKDEPPSALVEASRTRLSVLGMGDAQIAQIERADRAEPLVTVHAPHSGTVLRRPVNVGTAVDPSTEIMTIADLSRVWAIAEIPEGAASQVTAGTHASLRFPTSGRAAIQARVQFVYPTLTERTRTTRVRFALTNADGRLPPGTYGTAEFAVAPREMLTVSRDAVVDTGQTQHVFVRTAPNVLEPRLVRAGARLGERIEVLEGIAPGEQIATAGVFLIDSESRLRASGVPGHAGHAPPERTSGPSQKDTAPPPHSGHGA